MYRGAKDSASWEGRVVGDAARFEEFLRRVVQPRVADDEAAFDADLRARDARWGLRRLGELTREAAVHGLELAERVAMPANNFTLIWRRSAQHRG